MIFSSLYLDSNEAIYIQIKKYIKDMISKGMITKESKLPSTRELSKILKVSRNSVIAAYQDLESEDILYTIKGKGTFVSDYNTNKREKWKIEWNEKSNNYGKLAEELDIVKSEIPWEKNLISFKSISPEGDLFDVEEFKKAFLNRIAIEGHKILNYGYAKGYKPLVGYLLEYMVRKGVDVSNKDILITNGFTEGLEIILSSFTNPNDKIICENPTHNTALKLMKVNGLDIIGVNMREDGIDLEDLEKKLANNKISFSYLIPSYHNPTGIVMKPEKRYEVYNILKKYNVPIIEDGFNEELLYTGSHISPISALDSTGNGVIYIGSLSKILFPGIRIGWILADKRMIEILESVKRCKNIHTSFLDQAVFYEYIKDGGLEKHMKKIKKVYKDKYKFALKCIQKYIETEFIWGEGGLHLFIKVKGLNSRSILSKCYKKSVIFTPGDIFYLDDGGNDTIRLGISRLNLQDIEKGIKIIGQVIKELRRES